MPMAPATGLLLRTAGFSRLDTRAGACAMDPEQAQECMLPADGFVLMDSKAHTIQRTHDALKDRIEVR